MQLHGAQHRWSGPAVGSTRPALYAHATQPRTADTGLVGVCNDYYILDTHIYSFLIRLFATQAEDRYK